MFRLSKSMTCCEKALTGGDNVYNLGMRVLMDELYSTAT